MFQPSKSAQKLEVMLLKQFAEPTFIRIFIQLQNSADSSFQGKFDNVPAQIHTSIVQPSLIQMLGLFKETLNKFSDIHRC